MSEPTRRGATIIVFAYMVMVAFFAGAAILRGETANAIRLFEAGGSLAAMVVLIEAGVPLARAVRNKSMEARAMFERVPGLPVFPDDSVARQLFFAGVKGAAAINAVFGILAFAMLHGGHDPFPVLVMAVGFQLYLIAGLGTIYIEKQDGGGDV